MSRVQVSTTVDGALLAEARTALAGMPDAQLIDEAFRALLVRYRSEIDAAYAAAYEAHPIDEPDEWGDLASFRRAGDSASLFEPTSIASSIHMPTTDAVLVPLVSSAPT